jgi:hypothetical protein
MAKISELPVGNDLLLTDEIPANRSGTNIKILGKDVLTTKLRNPQPINLSGVVQGTAIFDGVSAANITTTISSLSSGITNKVVVNDGSGYLKEREANQFIWNTSAVPLTGNLNAKYLPKALTPNTLINSAIMESDLNHIGIRIVPTVELTVGGQISATDSISTSVDLSANQNLFVKQNAVIGENSSSSVTINGATSFPNANANSTSVKIGGVGVFNATANILKVGGKLQIDDLDITALSDSVITEEAGVLKYRPINSQVWDNSTTLIEGNGHADFIPRYTSSKRIEDSVICEKFTKIGIGTHSPNEKLTVNGSISAVGLKLSDGYTPGSGIIFGGDVNLYRADDNVLRTDENLVVGTIINDNTINDVLVHDLGLIKQRQINEDVWDVSSPLIKGSGSSSQVPIFDNNRTIKNSNIKQDSTGNIEISQKLFLGSSAMDVEQEITNFKLSKTASLFYSINQNTTGASNPNIPVSLFSYKKINPPRIGETFTSIDNLVTLFNPSLLVFPNTTISVSQIESFLIKFKIKARLERPKGNVKIQIRRNSTENWVTGTEIIELVAEDFSDSYRVISTTNEIVFHDKGTGTFEWRLLDTDTSPFVSPFTSANVTYEVSAELLGFYFKFV